MKKMKKVLSLVLAMVMILSLGATPTWAAGRGQSGWSSVTYGAAEDKTEDTAEVLAEELAAPADESEVPAEEPAAPAEETEVPAEEPAAPAEEPEVPAEEPAAPASEPEALEENIVSYPAVTLAGMTEGSVAVRVEAPEGALPEGTTMTLKDVTVEEVQAKVSGEIEGRIVTAVDITFRDLNDNEIQPNGNVAVSIKAPELAEAEAQELGVLHINEEKKEAEELTAEENAVEVKAASADEVAFVNDAFSIYVVVETGNEARLFVNFVGLKNSPIASIPVKQGDKMDQVLYDPGAGTLEDGVYFRGWTTDADYTTATPALTISDVRTAVAAMLPPASDGTEVTYYAMLFKDYRITYLDEKNISLGQEEVTFRADAASAEQQYKVNMAYTVQNENYHFEGWKVKDGSSNIVGYETDKAYQNNETITITGDVTFSVNAPEGHWFIFDANGKGATYNAPQFVYSADKPRRPNDENMIRNGYRFGGWYSSKAIADDLESTEEEYDFDQLLTDKTTVYARWIPNTTAGYTIIIWKQNLAGDGYDFVESIPKTGNVGSNIDTVRYEDGDLQVQRNGNTWSTVEYTGFHYKSFDQNVSIKTEGNSVLNIYFDRNEHTLRFKTSSGGINTKTKSYNGTTYTLAQSGSNYYIQINGKWYRVTGSSVGNYFWGDYAINSNYNHVTNITPGGSIYFKNSGLLSQWHGPYSIASTATELTDSSEVKTITALYGQPIGENFPIVGTNGVTYNNGERWSPQNSTTYNQVLVYIDTMPDEDVTFIVNTSTYGTKTITYYTEVLSGETPDITYNGKGFKEYKSVDAKYGFFTEAEDYINFVGFSKGGTTYPPRAYNSNGTQLNSVWNNENARYVQCYYTRIVYPINFMDGKYVNGDNNPLEESGMSQIHIEEDIAYGADISAQNNYKPDATHTPSGYVFEGWYLDDACTQPYTFSTMPEGGITVYAKWRQKQYRVFLHVNYPEGATGYIDWGTANQALTFRISEGGHVSEPTGRGLAGYAFDGWYLDPEYTRVFNGEAYTINESNVTTPYDKSVDMTDTYDVNGQLVDPKRNSDLTGWDDDGDENTPGKERFWITKKLDIYAKWHATLDGASGIVVEYDANGGSGAPTDIHTYVDTAKAPAGAASTAQAGSGKVFGYWAVMKWTESGWAETGETVLPGDTFTVLKANAKVEELATAAPNGDTKKYTVQLKAVYIDSEKPTPTHICWFENDGTEAFHTDKVTGDLGINEAVNIQPAPTDARIEEGYKFKGWARVKISSSQDYDEAAGEAAAWEANSNNWKQDNLELFLYYNEANGKFYKEAAFTNEAKEVAADEELPYHAMFAVWEAKYYVFNSSTGVLHAYTLEKNVDLTDYVSDGHLYGGYYSAYGAYNATDGELAAAMAEAEKNGTYETHAEVYTGDAIKAKNGNRFWSKANQLTAKGTSVNPKPNDVYFLKEVPKKYLNTDARWVYDVTNNDHNILYMYLITVIDDPYYSQVGYKIISKDKPTKVITAKFTAVNQQNGVQSGSQTISAATYKDDGISRGYLGVVDASTEVIGGLANGSVSVQPYWITPDGVTVRFGGYNINTKDGNAVKDGNLEHSNVGTEVTYE